MCVCLRKGNAESVIQTRLKSQSYGRCDAVQQIQGISDKPELNVGQLTGI